jgi:hypothetical protein
MKRVIGLAMVAVLAFGATVYAANNPKNKTRPMANKAVAGLKAKNKGEKPKKHRRHRRSAKKTMKKTTSTNNTGGSTNKTKP